MTSLSKEKRNQLMLVVLVTAAVLAGLWYGLVVQRQAAVNLLIHDNGMFQAEIDKQKRTIVRAPETRAELETKQKQLADLEQNMAPKGNETLWMRDLMDAATKHAGFAMTSQNTAEPRPTRLLPKFPYQEAGLYFSGKAFFHQFGRFVADLENRFPYVRLEGLMLTPLAANTPTSDQDRAGGLSTPTEDSYKLEFTVWVVALIRPE